MEKGTEQETNGMDEMKKKKATIMAIHILMAQQDIDIWNIDMDKVDQYKKWLNEKE